MSDLNRRSGIVSTGNSSATPLTASSVFTGTVEEILPYAQVSIMVKASHDSAVDGLSIQWSSDGTNFDNTDEFTVLADFGKIFTFGAQAKYFRVVYTNGGTNQTYFRLHTTLKMFAQKASTHRITSAIVGEDDAELVKAILTGERVDTAGLFNNIRSTSDGRLLVSQEAVAPVDTTPIVQLAQSSISADSDTVYTITNGKSLVIQLFIVGSQENSIGGSKVTLYDDPNGDLSVLNLITVSYVNGTTFFQDLRQRFEGDGTRRIVMRRSVFGGGSREVFARWQGFEE